MNNIIKNNIPNFLTFMALFFDCLAILFIFKEKWQLSFVFVIIALIFDILDGAVARYLKIDSSLGRQLDGFVDTMTYILYPTFFIYFYFNQDSFLILLCMFLFISAGIFRLARFNILGFVKNNHENFYMGMPVFYNLLIPIILLFFKLRYKDFVEIVAIFLLLLSSFCMVQTWPFYKPNKKVLSYIILGLIILSIIIIYGNYSI